MADIFIAREVDDRLVEAFGRLMPQLSASVRIPLEPELRRIVDSASSMIFCAQEAGEIVGVLSMAWYDVPSGRNAWIEDVVVDTSQRGCGVGVLLVRSALKYARRVGADNVSLTSHASRSAAHALYIKMGFERYETTLFRKKKKEE